MVTFQQPFDIVGMRRQQMLESQNDQEMQQRNQALLVGALGDLAGMYQQQEQMKAGVKSGEQMLKMFGPQLGVDSKILSSPEYKAMGLQGQSAMHGNLWGSLGAISQLRMAGMRDNTQRAGQQITAGTPIVRQQITNANTRAEEGDYFDATSLR
jgi:hypothetical protein